MKCRIVAYFSIITGISIMIFWIILFILNHMPEGKIQTTYLLFSEFMMAVICSVSGILMLKNSKSARSINILGLGMVIYAVLNAAGYYGETGNIALQVMFSVLFIFTSIAVLLNLKSK